MSDREDCQMIDRGEFNQIQNLKTILLLNHKPYKVYDDVGGDDDDDGWMVMMMVR